MTLSSSDVLNYYRCPRLLFLNKHGEKSLQLPPSDFLQRLWKVGRDYESKVIQYFKYRKPKYKVGDYETGLKETIKLMEEGVDYIYQGVLKNDDLIGIPDILIKKEGYSKFGNYYYYPVDIKGASSSRDKYLFQLASYAYVLGEIQTFTPLQGGLMLLNLDLQIRYLHDFMPQVINMIEKSKSIVSDYDNMPDLFIDSNCQQCMWSDLCLPEAHKKKDLSLVPTLNRKIKAKLQNISINNYAELANCSKEDLANIESLANGKGHQLILQAKALNEGKIYLKSIPELPETHGKEIIMDFESDFIMDDTGTDIRRVDYLIGLLKFEDQKPFYYCIILDESEEKLLEEFSGFIKEHPDFTFFHYGHYEQSVLDNKWNTLPNTKLFNLEKAVRDSLIMPVTSYSLKHIAKTLGFKWTNKEASATQSMCWYSQYLQTNDRQFLNLSIQYNMDDCLALYTVKEWLSHLKEKNIPIGKFIDIKEAIATP